MPAAADPKSAVIDTATVTGLKKRFIRYARTFACGDAHQRNAVELKLRHSFRVCKEITAMAKALQLNPEDLRLAQMMAILHDIGRFEQFARHRTFIDSVSVDHAELGVTIIDENHILDRFDPEARDLIVKAVLYHNRRALPRDETPRLLFFSRLLRDSDKLDIWQVVIDTYLDGKNGKGYGIGVTLPDTPGISDGVYSALSRKQIVPFDHLQNLNDLKLFFIGWVYDINFPPAFRRISQRKYLDRIQSALPRKPDAIVEVCVKAQAYLDEKITGATRAGSPAGPKLTISSLA